MQNTTKQFLKKKLEEMPQDLKTTYEWKLNSIARSLLPSIVEVSKRKVNGNHLLSDIQTFEELFACWRSVCRLNPDDNALEKPLLALINKMIEKGIDLESKKEK